MAEKCIGNSWAVEHKIHRCSLSHPQDPQKVSSLRFQPTRSMTMMIPINEHRSMSKCPTGSQWGRVNSRLISTKDIMSTMIVWMRLNMFCHHNNATARGDGKTLACHPCRRREKPRRFCREERDQGTCWIGEKAKRSFKIIRTGFLVKPCRWRRNYRSLKNRLA
jgi:hypothetical protein